MLNFNLINQESLDKILKAEIFVHSDGQLRAAHLILSYTPISKSFLAPKCVIKAKGPCLQRIIVAAPGFLITDPIPKGTLATGPIPEGIPKIEASSSCSIIEEKEKEQEKEGEIVEVSDSEDDFKVFYQLLSSNGLSGGLRQSSPLLSSFHQWTTPPSDDMGIQRKPRSTL